MFLLFLYRLSSTSSLPWSSILIMIFMVIIIWGFWFHYLNWHLKSLVYCLYWQEQFIMIVIYVFDFFLIQRFFTLNCYYKSRMAVFRFRLVIMISHDSFPFSYSNFSFSYSDFRISHSDFSTSHIGYWNSIGDFELIPLLSCLACHSMWNPSELLNVQWNTIHSFSSRQFCHVIQLSALSSLHVFHAILRCLDWYLVIWNRNQNALKKKRIQWNPDFSNLPISRTKPCFPWIYFTRAL